MKKRIPFDVEFLLESILSESPDKIIIDKTDAENLKSRGLNRKPIYAYWDEIDAYPFFIEPKDKIVIYRHNNTHGVMEATLRKASLYCKSERSFSMSYELSYDQGNIGFGVKDHDMRVAYFYGLNGNTLEDVRKYMSKHKMYFRNLEIRGGGGDNAEAIELAGRIWVDKNAVSFWNDKAAIMPYMDKIFGFIKNFNMNVENAIYQFLDSREFYTYKELTGNEPDTKEKLTAAEKQELLGQKHIKITPADQEKFKAEFPSQHWRDKGKKAAKGFEYPAQATAAMPALEGHIKLKDLLKESPDSVYNVEGTERMARYMDSDAIAFFVYPKFSAINVGGTHTDIMEALQIAQNNIDSITDNPDEKRLLIGILKNWQIEISDIEGMLDSVYSGPLADFIKDGIHDDDDPGAFRIKSGGLAGRIWYRKKIISFWNGRAEVMQKWADVERLYKDFAAKFGPIEEYKVDWLERDIRKGGPLTPTTSLTAGMKTDVGQMDFIDKLASEEPIDPEEIKRLQRELHLMTPKEKKKALEKLGAKNTKTIDIANKLGMSVAEFNHIMNVNEANTSE